MKNSKPLNSLLFVSGLIGICIGAAILIIPAVFHSSNGIDLGNNVNLLSEVRAPGGALLACGILIILGVFIQKLTFTSLVVSATLYLSYGLSRLLSMSLDGMPSQELLLVTGLELVFGVLAVLAFIKYQSKNGILQTSD